MDIKSITDIITNSSSEVFVVKRLGDFEIDDLKEFTEEMMDPYYEKENYDYDGDYNHYSGDARELEIRQDKETTRIIIDEDFFATKKYIKEHFKVIENYGF